MNTISPIKLLTAVGFLLVSMNSSFGFGEEEIEYKTAEACAAVKCVTTPDIIAECKTDLTESTKSSNGDTSVKEPTASAIKTCTKNKFDTCKTEICGNYSTIKDLKNQCATDTEKFEKAAEEASGACSSFLNDPADKKSKNNEASCKDKINACRTKISTITRSKDEAAAAGDPSNTKGTDEYADVLGNIFGQQEDDSESKADKFNPDAKACLNFKSKDARKENKTETKDLKREIKQLLKDIADEKKKINEENAKLRKENADLKSDEQKVNEAMKKAIRSVDEKKGEQLRKLNEDLAKSATAIRKMNLEIIKQKEAAETIKFDYAQRMMQYTSDKINTQCQAAIDTAKQCFIKSAKGQASSDPKDPCVGFTFSGKGAKGTAQLKAKIQKVREACFEQASMSVNKSKFEQGKALRTIETDILEKTNQVSDANKDIERRQTDFASITAESDKEKSDEIKNAEDQIANLKDKTAELAKSTNEAITLSNQRIAELQEQIRLLNVDINAMKTLSVGSDELENTFNDAYTVIKKKERARQAAIKSCCPVDNKDAEGLCAQFKEEDYAAKPDKNQK